MIRGTEKFDKILLDHAARQPNVTLLQPATVERVAFDADGVTAQVTDAAGPRELRARFLVDASGRDSFLASRHGKRRAYELQAPASEWQKETGPVTQRRPLRQHATAWTCSPRHQSSLWVRASQARFEWAREHHERVSCACHKVWMTGI